MQSAGCGRRPLAADGTAPDTKRRGSDPCAVVPSSSDKDVIPEIDRNLVRNGDDAVVLSKNLKGSVLLRIWRNGGTSYVVVDNARQRK